MTQAMLLSKTISGQSCEQAYSANLTVSAAHRFDARDKGELSFLAGDLLDISSKKEQNGFILATNKRTGERGWAPVSYVASTEKPGIFPKEQNDEEAFEPIPKSSLVDSITSHKSYFAINRRRAETMMLRPDVPTGTYLIRPSYGSGGKSFALSVRSRDERRLPDVKHYKINLSDDFTCLYIYKKRVFKSIRQLLEHYSSSEMPGTCLLSAPFPHEHDVVLVPLHELHIPRSEIRLMDRLGQGHFGEVWKGQFKSLHIAVKKTMEQESDADLEVATKMLISEATILASLRHENLIRLVAISSDKRIYWVITELMNRGSLRDFLQSREGRSNIRVFPDAMNILRQVAQGMEYLVERQKICHRDLRAANVLVHLDDEEDTLNYEIKIADFGLAKLLDEYDENHSESSRDSSQHHNTRLPIKWTPPEAILKGRFSTKSDVWSFGVLVYEVITYCSKVPYVGKNAQDVIDFVRNGGRIMRTECQVDSLDNDVNFSTKCPEELYRTMLNCWHRLPEKRPTFSALKVTFEQYARVKPT